MSSSELLRRVLSSDSAHRKPALHRWVEDTKLVLDRLSSLDRGA